MYYLMKAETSGIARGVVYRHGRALSSLNWALKRLRTLPYNSELRDQKNHLVAVRARDGILEVSQFVAN